MSTNETAIWSCDISQQISRFDSCQLTTTWMCNIFRSRTPTLARKLHIGFPVVRTVGREDVPKFLRWIYNQIFLAMRLRYDQNHNQDSGHTITL